MKEAHADLIHGIFSSIILMLFSIAVGFMLGCGVGAYDLKKQAVEAGAGRWVVNSETGRKSFEWRKE